MGKFYLAITTLMTSHFIFQMQFVLNALRNCFGGSQYTQLLYINEYLLGPRLCGLKIVSIT